MTSNDITPFNYDFHLPMEKPFYSIDYVHSMRDWVKSNLYNFYMISGAYILLVLIGREYMKNKPKFELRLPLIVWNAFISVFSIIGTIRCLPGLF
jgi:elongation of very long chain fatty acids protein 6